MTPEIGRALFVLGLLVAAVGLAAMLGLRLPLGHLPGDIAIVGSHGGIYVPIVTCIVLSLLLTILLNVVTRR